MSSKKQKLTLPETDSGPHQTSNMELVLKCFNGFRW